MHLRQDWKRRARRLGCIAIAALLLWSVIAWAAALCLITSAPLERADAIVVFSGAYAYRERAARAAELFQEGRARAVILTNDNQQSGWSSREQRNPLFVERAREELLELGVPADKVIILPGVVTGTYEEAALVRDYATSNGLRSILFVTSQYHSRRALWTVRRTFAGTQIAVGLETARPGTDTPSPLAWWLRPRGWSTVASEYPKLIYYRLWYG